MYEELKYLRNELNQRVSFHSEYASKTINMVLVIWGGGLILLGKDGAKFTEMSLENIPVYFIVATIFFISNLILYYTARKYYRNADSIHKLTAYIIVFYEKQPDATDKDGENFCWDLANFEIMARNRHKKSRYKKNVEYTALTIVSTALIFILLASFSFNIFAKSGVEQIVCIIVSLICIIYLGVSISLLREIPKCTSARDDYGMRIQHLKNYIQYAFSTGHDTEESLKNRLGKVWELIYSKS